MPMTSKIAIAAKEKVFKGDKNFLTERLVAGDINGCVSDIKDIMRAKVRNDVKSAKEILKKIW